MDQEGVDSGTLPLPDLNQVKIEVDPDTNVKVEVEPEDGYSADHHEEDVEMEEEAGPHNSVKRRRGRPPGRKTRKQNQEDGTVTGEKKKRKRPKRKSNWKAKPRSEMTPEELAKAREKSRRNRENMPAEKREAARLKLKENYRRKKLERDLGLAPPLKKKPYIKPSTLTEEEKRLQRERKNFQQMIKRLTMTEEERRERQAKYKMYYITKKAMQSEEDKKKVKRAADMTPEELEKYREYNRMAHKRLRDRWKESNPEKYAKLLERYKINLRRAFDRETPEQTQKRLLKGRIYRRKRDLKERLEKEGVPPEEIERRVNELVEEMKSQPLPPLRPPRKQYNRKTVTMNYNSSGGGESSSNQTSQEGWISQQRQIEVVQPAAPPILMPQVFQHQPFESLKPALTLTSNSNFTFAQNEVSFGTTSQVPGPGPSSYSGWKNFSMNKDYQSLLSSSVSVSSALSVNDNDDDDYGDFGGDSDDLYVPPTSPPAGSPIEDFRTMSESESTCAFHQTSPASFPQVQPEVKVSPNVDVTPEVPKRRGRGRPPKNTLIPTAKSTSEITTTRIKPTDSNKKGVTLASTKISSSVLLPCPATSCSEMELKVSEPSIKIPPMSQSSSTTTSKEAPADIASSMKLEPRSSSKPTFSVSVPTLYSEPVLVPEICDECGETFKSKFSLRIHKSEAHDSNSNSLTCPKCSAQCNSKLDLWDHFVKIHHHMKSYKESKQAKDYRKVQQENVCTKCGKRFVQKATLLDHIRRVHQGKSHRCDLCGSDCQSLTKLWRHKVERHNMKDLPPPIQAVSCKYCGEILMRGYKAHVKKKHPNELEEFLKSDDNVKLTGIRVFHEKAKTPELEEGIGDKEVQCTFCSETMLESVLSLHVRDKHSFPCPECGKICEDVPQLEEHYRYVHALDDIDKKLEKKNLIKFTHPMAKTAVCLLCKANLGYLDEIRAHFVSFHHEVLEEFLKHNCRPRVECELCDLVFITEVELSSHMEISHPDVSYLCPHCGAFRRTQEELDMHVRSHGHQRNVNKKKFGCCFICKKDFVELNEVDLRYAMGRQTRDKILEDLKTHVEKEHPENYFRCPYCPKWMYNSAGMRCHSKWCFNQTIKDKCELDLPQQEKRQSIKDYVTQTLRKMTVLCRVCKLEITMKHIMKHMERRHQLKQNYYQCPHCPRQFNLYEYCVAHMEMIHEIPISDIVLLPHSGNSNVKVGVDILIGECTDGGKIKGIRKSKYPAKNYVKHTLRKMRLLCGVCKRVINMKAMKFHMESRHQIKVDSYQCEHCPRSFSLYEYWVAHVEITHKIPLSEIVLIPGEEDLEKHESKFKRIKETKRGNNLGSCIMKEEIDDIDGSKTENNADKSNDIKNSTTTKTKAKPRKVLGRTSKSSKPKKLNSSEEAELNIKFEPSEPEPNSEHSDYYHEDNYNEDYKFPHVKNPTKPKRKIKETTSSCVHPSPSPPPKRKRGRPPRNPSILNSKRTNPVEHNQRIQQLYNYAAKLESEKRLVIYLYRLTEEDMKPYIKMIKTKPHL